MLELVANMAAVSSLQMLGCDSVLFSFKSLFVYIGEETWLAVKGKSLLALLPSVLMFSLHLPKPPRLLQLAFRGCCATSFVAAELLGFLLSMS